MNQKNLLQALSIAVCLLCTINVVAQEAYVAYHESDYSLVFFYDEHRSYHQEPTYDLNTGNNAPGWYDDGNRDYVQRVEFTKSFASARPTSTYAWFLQMHDLDSIKGLENLNTSQVTDMSYMFYGCEKLTSLDLRQFDTGNVTNMYGMFYGCKRLAGIDLSTFNTANITNMGGMFRTCNALASLDLSTFNTAHVTKMSYMFLDCGNLTTIHVGDGWNTAAVTISTDMFKNCYSLVGGKGTTHDASHVDVEYARIDDAPNHPGYFTAPSEPTGYVVYTPHNATMTFYYDGYMSSRQGMVYVLNKNHDDPHWSADAIIPQVTHVVFDPSFADARPSTTRKWFCDMSNLNDFEGLEYLNTSQVIDMSYMFQGCGPMRNLDLSHFDTSQVTDMSYMFYNCSRLTGSLDLSSFNTSQVSDMRYMFYGCVNLVTIYADSTWSNSNVTAGESVFVDCNKLVGGKGTAYDSNHTDASYAQLDGGPSNPGYLTIHDVAPYVVYTTYNKTLTFYYDDQRSVRPGQSYDLNMNNAYPKWYVNRVNSQVTQVVFDPSFADARPTTTCAWFYDMENLESVTGLNYLNTSLVTDMSYMFCNCPKLQTLDVSHFNTSQVKNMRAMFGLCYELQALDVSHFDTSQVTDMCSMFWADNKLTSLDVAGFNTSKVTNMIGMFQACFALTSLDLSHFDTSQVTNMNQMFSGCKSLTSLDVSSFNTSQVTDMSFMFNSCQMLSSLDVSGFNTSKVRGMIHMFSGCSELQALDVNQFNTSQVTSMQSMFSQCSALKELDVSGLNTQNVTDMSYMFSECNGLTTLDLRGFNTSNVTNMQGMFYGPNSLKSIDLSSFNTAKVTKMEDMFSSCKQLTTLDLSNFSTASLETTRSMFLQCNNLTTVYVDSTWDVTSVPNTILMFINCYNLVGGMGTTYDPNHIDGLYARIDGGNDFPGYFTAKNAGLRGDVDGDGSVEISDVTALIDYLLRGNATGINLSAADCDADGSVEISDVTALIDYLLAGHWKR